MRKYFGTDGIRKIAGSELTPELSYKVAKAAAYVLSKNKGSRPTILIGRDTRISGTLIESAMVAGFLSCGAYVISLGTVPTPAVAYLTRTLKSDAGVVISASHNSFEFNGIKFFSNKGIKFSDSVEEEIEKVMDSEDLKDYYVKNENIGVLVEDKSLINKYVDFIYDIFKNKIKVSNDFKACLDCANGATYKVAKMVYDKLNINYDIISDNPNGININDNCGSTHLENLKDHVIQNKCNIGFAYDGDGDRCLAVDEKGNTIDGDKIMALLADYLKKNDKLSKDTLVATVMSNLGLSKFAEENNINLVRTKVGDRYVVAEMLENGYNLGGEQSGHIILLDYNPTGDGILTSLMVISCLLEKDMQVSESLKIINIYPQVLVNAKVKEERKNDYMTDVEIKKAIETLEKEFEGNGRVLIRPSGTEPLVRVMIEGSDKNIITEKATELANFIEERLSA